MPCWKAVLHSSISQYLQVNSPQSPDTCPFPVPLSVSMCHSIHFSPAQEQQQSRKWWIMNKKCGPVSLLVFYRSCVPFPHLSVIVCSPLSAPLLSLFFCSSSSSLSLVTMTAGEVFFPSLNGWIYWITPQILNELLTKNYSFFNVHFSQLHDTKVQKRTIYFIRNIMDILKYINRFHSEFSSQRRRTLLHIKCVHLGQIFFCLRWRTILNYFMGLHGFTLCQLLYRNLGNYFTNAWF